MPEIVNFEMAAAWDGAEGDSWVAREEHMNRSLVVHTQRLLEVADVGRSEHVLDVGCGCGETTREFARRALDGDALGVDLSHAMLERAGQRAEEAGIANVRFEPADAQVFPFLSEGFDLLTSRFGVMFFGDPVAAFTNLHRAVKPGGRAVLLVWQRLAENEWLTAVRDALAVGRTLPEPPPNVAGPFGLADPDHARSVLDAAGFARVELDALDAKFWFGNDDEDAFAFAKQIGPVRGLLEGLDPDQTALALDSLHATLAAHDTGDGVWFDSRAWVVTAFR
jgi:SAM-dependent methyltransferase